MAESSIQRARRLARERREREEAEAALLAAEAAKPEAEEEVEESGFFSSFFGRGESIDSAVEAAQGRQSTDKANQ